MTDSPNPDLDLGHDHYGIFFGWYPDRELNPHTAHLPDVERYGLEIIHPSADPARLGKPCAGYITFAGPVQQEIAPNQATWDVLSWSPLTLSPSVLCSCGDHGYIRNGVWVPA